MKLEVLDKGFVELVDVMGDDRAIVDAARVSVSGKGVKATSTDKNLLRYLLRHKHTSPFEMVEFKFNCKMPIFVARQWVRHRTASLNEVSARYSILPDEFYIPHISRLKEQAKDNKQGSGKELEEGLQEYFQNSIIEHSKDSYALYEEMIADGVARELARIVLPTNIYTQWFWKIDLHNLLHFLQLRLHPHAQEEIRAYAQAISEIVKICCPVTWEAFEDYRLHAETFSAAEISIIRTLVADKDFVPTDLSSRETVEFVKKLRG